MLVDLLVSRFSGTATWLWEVTGSSNKPDLREVPPILDAAIGSD